MKTCKVEGAVMSSLTVGLLSPGDMGHAVGQMLIRHGAKVITCLEGRSERTRALAQKAGIGDVPSYGDLIRESDMIISILVPSEAEATAARVAQAVDGADLVYVDCNAVAPATVKRIGEVITGAGGQMIDAGIIGGPPQEPRTTRFYCSGPDTSVFMQLNEYGLDVRSVGTEVGQASGFKMCYAAGTKGVTALQTELLVAAKALGLYDALIDELGMGNRLVEMERGIPGMPVKAKRWIGEMEEIAKTFGDLGLTSKMYEGAADMYRLVSETPLADETPETRDKSRTLAQVVEILDNQRGLE
ncbi:MAG: 3-hydroxyisobutyrate dehydrogenase-like beta-hydroxyacid dehydrogenase [Candidatus Latescibacterota bacterium]|jgi:3-hydroxyisobutyrate dehydrogenase-like beta-hydroxyacid dehydrogenase